ncbi:hypothetical protein SAMN04489725_10831 [Alicyclobacillus hesperidum]|uniref:Uncharacterized protein n=1 Tax=Alicyclobacillus hesperidum TaxID=89784 RepID=A0A1H2UJY2_9BACL|nr:hypothetical protein SAMN04489725_10831 [Alicyclobacillus hesperidum]
MNNPMSYSCGTCGKVSKGLEIQAVRPVDKSVDNVDKLKIPVFHFLKE